MNTLRSFVSKYKQYFYFIAMAIMAIALPVSEFLMSISIFALAIAWLLNGPKKTQWQAFNQNKLAWITVSIFLIEVVGLINTSNYDYAFSELRNKLPLLLVPVFIAPARFSNKEFKGLLALFVGSTMVGSLICFINYQFYLKDNLINFREVSIFISHIRFGLMINLSILILIYYAIILKNKWSFALLAMTFWFGYFLLFLGSGNGYFIFGVLLLVGFIALIIKSPYTKIGIGVGFLFILFNLYVGILSNDAYHSYFVPRDVAYNNPDNIQKKNERGHRLSSNINNKHLQNGYFVWRNITRKELKKEWGKRADEKYLTHDIKQQIVMGTLIKYLTSKGYPKDSVGASMLSDQDIKNIEMGFTDYRQENWNNLEVRVDHFFFQLYAIVNQKNPGGKPFMQRLYYLEGAFSIIENNFFFGVGTGDIQDEFDNYYKEDQSKLQSQYRVRTHNQFLTYFITLGIFGFIWFLYATIYPLIRFSRLNFILAVAQLVLLLSFLTEDTLETQPGVTLYAFVIALGIIAINMKKSELQKRRSFTRN